jgi:hypothetical protein
MQEGAESGTPSMRRISMPVVNGRNDPEPGTWPLDSRGLATQDSPAEQLATTGRREVRTGRASGVAGWIAAGRSPREWVCRKFLRDRRLRSRARKTLDFSFFVPMIL